MTNKNKPDIFRPRWNKVLSDLWDSKFRTILVVASIAVGVFAIGVIASAYAILSEDIDSSYAAVNPANITIRTEPFGEGFLRSVRRMPGVAGAEGRHNLSVSVVVDGEPRRHLAVIAVNDFAGSKIGLLESIEGRLVPDDYEMLIRFDPMNDLGYRVGDVLAIELSDGTIRQVPLVGIVADQSAEVEPGQITKGYVTHDSLAWLG